MFNVAAINSFINVPKSELENLDYYRNQFTFVSKYDPSVVIKGYNETDEWFGFPRHAYRLSANLANHIIDERQVNNKLNMKTKFELYGYQQKLINEFQSLVKQGGTGFFLVAAPGAGKTVMGIECLKLLNQVSLIVVPKSDLVEQWLHRFIEHTNLKREDIAIANNGGLEANWRKARIVIGIVHTLALDRFGEEFKSKFGCILYDEADSSVPPATFSCVPGLFPAKYRIGMTATRYRSDGLHQVFEQHLGQYFLSCHSDKVMTPKVIQLEYSGSNGWVNPNLEFKFRRGQLITILASNVERNQLIAKYILSCYKADRDTLVLSDRKDQLEYLYELLTSRYSIPKTEIGYFVRNLNGKSFKKEYKEKVLSEAKIILGTYGMASRGTDIKRLSALVLATPQMNMTQISGRIERFLQGKKVPVIIDFIDTAYKDAVSSGHARLNQYRKRGMEIKRYVISK